MWGEKWGLSAWRLPASVPQVKADARCESRQVIASFLHHSQYPVATSFLLNYELEFKKKNDNNNKKIHFLSSLLNLPPFKLRCQGRKNPPKYLAR